MAHRNCVLRGLAGPDMEALAGDLQAFEIGAGEVLYEPDGPVEWVWLPETAVLSVVTLMADGRTVETDTVGYESLVGALPALASSVSVSRTFAQIPGRAQRLPAASVRRRAEESRSLRRLLLRHAQANLAQAHQSVACNALHSVRHKLARWLLMSLDRTTSKTVRITQQYLAIMVGVQRTTITQALRAFEDEGLIECGRRRIEILDRAKLEQVACECYESVRAQFERLLGFAPPKS